MNSEFRKPYLAEIYGVPAKQRRFVYSRETLTENDIFPFYVLDGGAFFFMNEIFGTTKSSDLLELTMSGKIFDPLRKANGEIDWERSYNLTDGTGLHAAMSFRAGRRDSISSCRSHRNSCVLTTKSTRTNGSVSCVCG